MPILHQNKHLYLSYDKEDLAFGISFLYHYH
nr:MAG TPA: hypothetical protein [Caudoviricetes sp.]